MTESQNVPQGESYDPYQGQQSYQAQQPYQASYEQPQVAYQQVYAQPVAPAAPAALYPMTDTDRTLRLVAFIFVILSLVGSCWLIIPLAWMIPMAVISWGIYKGTKANTVAFGVAAIESSANTPVVISESGGGNAAAESDLNAIASVLSGIVSEDESVNGAVQRDRKSTRLNSSHWS